MKRSLLYCVFALVISCRSDVSIAQTERNWTILYYAAGSNSSERDLMPDVEEMLRGKMDGGYHFLLLIDRIAGYADDSTTLGADFEDTRLYQIENNDYKRLDGAEELPEVNLNSQFEGNMGDAHLLRQFIRFGKKRYPAKHYMLIIRSHGNGLGMCPDSEGGVDDRLYPGELSDVLTANESVDILGLDVCSMAGLENCYEWRPGTGRFSADYILASAPLSAAWAYDELLGRLQPIRADYHTADTSYFQGGPEYLLDPATMQPEQFAKLIIEEIYDSQQWASWALLDNKKINDVKLAMDALAQQCTKEPKQLMLSLIENTMTYFHGASENHEQAELALPYRDAYGFVEQLAGSEDVGSETRRLAKEALQHIDQFVVHSYHGRGFFPDSPDFVEGNYGAYLILPQGKRTYSASGRTFWAHTSWFHPNDRRSQPNSYGLYDWCSDNATEGNNRVENFFEYLDWLFDASNNSDGGENGYQW